MDFSGQHRESGKKAVGIAILVAVHAVAVYALLTLKPKAIEVQKPTLDVKIIEAPKPPQPKELPPPPLPTPKLVAPPPPFIPPPEVNVATPPPTNAITAVTNVKPETPVMPKPSAPAPVAAP